MQPPSNDFDFNDFGSFKPKASEASNNFMDFQGFDFNAPQQVQQNKVDDFDQIPSIEANEADKQFDFGGFGSQPVKSADFQGFNF